MAAELAEAMRELGEISDLAGRAGSYAGLAFSLDTADPERGALLQRGRELGAEIETLLLFFDLEWNELPDERADELLANDELAFCRHYLGTLRRYRPHQLSEPEERVLTETGVTGASAFRRLFTEQTSAIEVDLPDTEAPVPLEEALSRLHHPDRDQSAGGGRRVTDGAAARPAYARVRVQHPPPGQGGQGPAALLPALAGLAQPRERGERRVGDAP